jgi:hypothetical protein
MAASTTHERAVTLARAQRSEETCAAIWSAGAARALEQVIAEASAEASCAIAHSIKRDKGNLPHFGRLLKKRCLETYGRCRVLTKQ